MSRQLSKFQEIDPDILRRSFPIFAETHDPRGVHAVCHMDYPWRQAGVKWIPLSQLELV